MADDDLYVLGLNTYDHDVSACLLHNGEIVVAISKERVTRIKHATGFHQEVVGYCLEAAGIELERVDLVVRNSYLMPVDELERRLVHTSDRNHLPPRERRQAEESPLFLPESGRTVNCSHHLAHAYSAFAVSPFEEGAVMVVDGVGSYRCDVLEDVPPGDEAPPLARESESYYRFRGTELETLRKVWMGPHKGILSDDFFFMPGLGAIYSRVSSYVFGDWNRCGEVMGLAPYGRAGPDRLHWLEGGELQVPDWDERRYRPFPGGTDDEWAECPQRAEYEDLAWRVQEDSERVLVQRARWLHEQTGSKNLCIAGGVGLNCVANGRILEQTPFENVFIQPAAGDDGVAIGCAYYGHLRLSKRKRTFVMEHAYLGRGYDSFDVDEALRPLEVRLSTTVKVHERLEYEVAKLLAAGTVVGWFQGRAEFGPRALGNRSILADPRDAAMRDNVNERVKHRQGFRPFAPVVLHERAAEYFELRHESPFMLLACRVRPAARDRIPAVVHVDGSARVQTLRERHNPRLYALLKAFEARTGEGVLLNTSFNLRGEPIVEAPMDAMDTFLRTGMGALVLHRRLITKNAVHRTMFPVIRFATGVRRRLRFESILEGVASKVLGG